MATAPSKAMQLARRLRDLREREWPDAELTQVQLAKALGAQYDTSVHLLVVQDPEIVGGIRVEIGDDVIDGTVASKLEDAQRKLAG
jgi:F-type H+-transporting ATPase subunit delta